MKAGAVEFLTKPFKDDVLLKGHLRRDRFGVRPHCSTSRRCNRLRSRYALLTPGEREVMALVCSGLLNKQVGGELGISEVSVKAHRGQKMRKMKAESLAELVTISAKLRVHVWVNPDRRDDHLRRLASAGTDTAAARQCGQFELRANSDTPLGTAASIGIGCSRYLNSSPAAMQNTDFHSVASSVAWIGPPRAACSSTMCSSLSRA